MVADDGPFTTREEIEQMLRDIDSPAKLDLVHQNLEGLDLQRFNFARANLEKADLSRANLSQANLRGANLKGANLRGASLRDANLHGANLEKANLRGVDLRGAKLVKANLNRAFLNGSDLHRASLLDSTLFRADFRGVILSEKEKEQLYDRGAIGLEKPFTELVMDNSALHIRLLEDPLTAQNLLTILSALTELSTKYWLIAKKRFADLIEYTQTHNGRFAEEAQVVITKISYNSPFNMDWKVDLSVPGVAEALVTTIDGITQRQERLEKAKLENQAKALEIKEVEQKAEQENLMTQLEQEKRRLDIEQRRLEILEKQLEVQKKGIEYALEIAGKVVDTLHPSADSATRAMEIQALLPNLVQLQNGKGLELDWPPPPSAK